MTVRQVGVVGTGLIGTSIGMALSRTSLPPVMLVDLSPGRAETAAALGAGVAVIEAELASCDHIVLAAPPSHIAGLLLRLQRLNLHATFSDVASIKSSVLREAEILGCDVTRFCPAHPIAGRERGGPTAAVPELFDDAVWVSTPAPTTSPEASADVRWLAQECGARAVEMSALEHDQALAVVSHLPQFVATLLATQLPDAGLAGPTLAGRGFRDTTRLADSQASLWVQIALGNAAALADAVTRHADAARALAEALKAGDSSEIGRLLRAGSDARAALPTKTSPVGVSWATLGVVLQDRPGELARLFAVAGDSGVNIEDVTIDHANAHPVGMVALSVAYDSVDTLAGAVRVAGWHVVPFE